MFILVEMSGTQKAVVSDIFFSPIFVHFTQTGILRTVGRVVSVESVHVDPAESDLAPICTYSLGYFGLLFSNVVEAWNLTSNRPEASDNLEMLLIFPECC